MAYQYNNGILTGVLIAGAVGNKTMEKELASKDRKEALERRERAVEQLRAKGGQVALYRDEEYKYLPIAVSEEALAKHGESLGAFAAALTEKAPNDSMPGALAWLLLLPPVYIGLSLKNSSKRNKFLQKQEKRARELAKEFGCQCYTTASNASIFLRKHTRTFSLVETIVLRFPGGLTDGESANYVRESEPKSSLISNKFFLGEAGEPAEPKSSPLEAGEPAEPKSSLLGEADEPEETAGVKPVPRSARSRSLPSASV